MPSVTFSRRLAIISGLALPLVETARRWHDWPGPLRAWPFWLDDYLIAALLIAAAIASRRSPAWLTAAWGIAAGLALGSALAQYGHIINPDLGQDPSGIAHHVVLLAKLGILAICVLGLVTSTCRKGGQSLTC